jgi:hypothetical protein
VVCVDTNLDLEPPNGDKTSWAWRNFLRLLTKVNQLVECVGELEAGGGGQTPETKTSTYGLTIDVPFGSSLATDAFKQTIGQSWVLNTTLFSVLPCGDTTDHPAMDATIEGIHATVDTIVPGDGFTLRVNSPLASTGTYRFHVIGVN